MNGAFSLARRRAQRFGTTPWFEQERINRQEPGKEKELGWHVSWLDEAASMAKTLGGTLAERLNMVPSMPDLTGAEEKEGEIDEMRVKVAAHDNRTTEKYETALLIARRTGNELAEGKLVLLRHQSAEDAKAKGTSLAYELRRKELVDEMKAEIRTAQIVAKELHPEKPALVANRLHLEDERAFSTYYELVHHVESVPADKERVLAASAIVVRDGVDIGVALDKAAKLTPEQAKAVVTEARQKDEVIDLMAEKRKCMPASDDFFVLHFDESPAHLQIANHIQSEALKHHDAVMAEAQQRREQAQSPVAEEPKRQEKGQGPSLDDELERIIAEDDNTRGERNEKGRAASKEMAHSWEAERAQEEGLTSFATSTIKGETKERVRAAEAQEKSEQEKPEISRDGRTNNHAVELGMIDDPSQAAYQSSEEAEASSEQTAAAGQGQARKLTADAEAEAAALVAQEEAAAKIKAAQAQQEQQQEQEAPRRGRRR